MWDDASLVYLANGQFLGSFSFLMYEEKLDVCDFVYATTAVGTKLVVHDPSKHKAWACTVKAKMQMPNNTGGFILGEDPVINVLELSHDREMFEMELEYLVAEQSWVHRIADKFHLGKDPERARFWAYYVVPTGIAAIFFAVVGFLFIMAALLQY